MIITAGSNIQQTIDTASDTDFVFEPGAHFEFDQLVVRRNDVRLHGVMPPPGRSQPTAGWPVLHGRGEFSIVLEGQRIAFGTGIELRNENADNQLLHDVGASNVIRHLVARGDPKKGQHRGIQCDGVDFELSKSYIDDCFAFGRDAQALATWDGLNTARIIDNYLEGGAQSVMFGGADALSAGRVPTNIDFFDNDVSKKPEWYALGVQIKCAIEFKAVKGFRLRGGSLKYAGISDGQSGYLIVGTPRNQDGRAPWSSVEDVDLSDFTGAFAGGIANFLGTDDANVSGRLRNFAVRRAKFTDIDPRGLTKGDGRGFLFNNGADRVTLEDIDMSEARYMTAWGYFTSAAPTALVIRRFKGPAFDYEAGSYDWKIDGGGQGVDALRAYAPDAVIEP